jgi:hypothetical protein
VSGCGGGRVTILAYVHRVITTVDLEGSHA